MKTRYAEIDIDHVVGTCVGHWDTKLRKFRKPYRVDMWRYLIDGSHVGPQMATRIEALAGLDAYAIDWGLIKGNNHEEHHADNETRMA